MAPGDKEGPLFTCCEKMRQAGPGVCESGVGFSPPCHQRPKSPVRPAGAASGAVPVPRGRCLHLQGPVRAFAEHILWLAQFGLAWFTPPAVAATCWLTWASLPFLQSGRQASHRAPGPWVTL